jgi:hypothetical protein
MLTRNPSKRGQAVVELLPSVFLFLIVVTAGLSYFRMMREVTIRQEVVRAMAFSKIDYSGTLTTPLTQSEGVLFLEGLPNGVAVDSSRFEFVGRLDPCFSVTPENVTQQIEAGSVFGLGRLNPLNVATYAVMYRVPGVAQCP